MVAASQNGIREIAAADFGQGYLTTALEPTEILVEVRFPPWPAIAGGTVVEVSRRHGDYALVGLACRIEIAEGTIAGAALSFFGVDNTAVRIAEAETALVGAAPDAELFATSAAIVTDTIRPNSDVHASANYRRHLAGVLTRRALTESADRIGARV
jgi:carbon-monoxide dehydrogenase medium subunit